MLEAAIEVGVFLVECSGCGRRTLCDVHRVRAVHNLAPGVIAVELACYCGRRVMVLTGPAVDRTSMVVRRR